MSEYKKKMDVKYAELYVTAIMVDERNKGYGQTPDAIETLLAAYHELKDKGTFREVLYESDGDADGYPVYDMARCPNCNHLFMDDEHDWGIKYCPECGQALKWDIEEDKENGT